MSDPIPFALRAAGTPPLVVVSRLLALAGDAPRSVQVRIRLAAVERAPLWRQRLSDVVVDTYEDEGTFVTGDADADRAAELLGSAADDVVEVRWDVSFWKDEAQKPLTPAADNSVLVWLNARDESLSPEPGAVELVVTVSSHAPDCGGVAALLADAVGASLA